MVEDETLGVRIYEWCDSWLCFCCSVVGDSPTIAYIELAIMIATTLFCMVHASDM